jgi:hypothetical protein
MRTLLVMFAMTALITIGSSLREGRQQTPRSSDEQAFAAYDGARKTITGCLEASEAQGAYVLQADGGQQVTIQGSDLAQHVNHRVIITGGIDRTSAIRPTAVETVSTSCVW